MKEVYSSPSGENFLTGYYDANVVSQDEKYLLSCRVTENFEYLKHSRDCQLCLTDLLSGQTYTLNDVNCFNYQQGCRSTFLNFHSSEFILFNKYSQELGYHSIISDLRGHLMDFTPCPSYSLSASTSQIVSIDFRRHDFLKLGYSYGYYYDNLNELLSYKQDSGLRIYDLNTKDYTHAIYLSDLPTVSSTDYQFFDHPLFNPDGSILAFYHRIKHDGQIVSHLYTFNLQTGKLTYLNRIKRGTHFNWYDTENLIIWGSLGTTMSLLRDKLPRKSSKYLLSLYKSIVRSNSETGNSTFAHFATGDQYLIVNSSGHSYTTLRCSCYNLNRDGHPTVLSEKNILITDTYPDEHNNCKLISIDLKNDKLLSDTSYYHNSSATRTPFRADLHPKVSTRGNHITIDTFQVFRQVKVFKI